MYPLNTYLQPHNLEENQFEDVDTCRSKDEVIEGPDQDTFLSHFHRAQYFSESSLDDAHNAIWGNSMMHCSASLAARRMSCERLLQEAGLINLSSSVPMSNSRKRKAEIIEVHGAGGRKDKHSKVCTARGTKDRRVRLSPRTAIEFYDVQDRLGYDRPSKAIDWLIKEAKTAIDALEEQQLPPLGSDHNQWSADHHGKLQTVSESGIVQKQEDLDHDDNHVSSFGFFLNTTASPIFHGDGFHPSGNQSSALENAIPNPGYQPGFISGLATNPQIFDTTWEVARLQRVLTVTEDSDNARASGVLEYTSPNYLPLRFQALPIPAGNNQGFCQAETTLQSGIINYSPISISFPGFCLSNELSNVAAAAILKDGANEKTDLSKTPAFLQYHKVPGGISG